jgi:hypothetical protein
LVEVDRWAELRASGSGGEVVCGKDHDPRVANVDRAAGAVLGDGSDLGPDIAGEKCFGVCGQMPEAHEGMTLATTHALVEVVEALAAEQLPFDACVGKMPGNVSHELGEFRGWFGDVAPVGGVAVRNVGRLVDGLIQAHLQAFCVTAPSHDLGA